MHLPIEVLRDKIKDLFEAAVPMGTHLSSFEYGLSHGLRFHQTDLPIAQSADNDNGYEGTDSQYKTFLHIYDNFIQFLWMLTYSAYVSHDASFLALTTSNGDEGSQYVANLRIAQSVYKEAIRMLEANDSDLYMKASRGRLFSYPNPYNKRDEHCDKVDAIVMAGCAYLLLHEYGHFHYNHDADTPANEIQADTFALEHLLEWANKQPDAKQCRTTVVLGVTLTLIAAAYVNPTLVSTSYPDIDHRIAELVSFSQKNYEVELSDAVKEMLWIAISAWVKTNKISDLEQLAALKVDERFEKLTDIIEGHKKQFKF